ncbi:hypothetical protein V9K98_33880, partial [Kribbella sp. CCNWLW197]
ADAVGIIADPRYTEELLHQAHEHLRTTPPAPPPTTNDSAPTTAPATGQDVAPTADPTTGQATPRRPDTTARREAAAQTANSAAGRDPAPTVGAATDQDAVPTAGRDNAPTSDRVPDCGDVSTTAPASSARASTGDPASVRDKATGGTDRGAERGWRARRGEDHGAWSGDEDLLGGWVEPGVDDEADRDAPYPGDSDLPDPLDVPFKEVVEPFDPGLRLDPDDGDGGEVLDAAARRALEARLAQVRHAAHTHPRTGRAVRPGQTEIYVHLTDHTLATGTGVLRVESLGPLLASQLRELVGHGPYTVKPVIDLHDAVSVDAYEIPDRIRERVKLLHPVELFPYGTRETHAAMDLDHIEAYDPLGPPGQTTPANLEPLRRFPHRVKTHGHWKVRRLDPTTLEWTTPHGFTFHVDPTGTHRAPKPQPDG